MHYRDYFFIIYIWFEVTVTELNVSQPLAYVKYETTNLILSKS